MFEAHVSYRTTSLYVPLSRVGRDTVRHEIPHQNYKNDLKLWEIQVKVKFVLV